MRAANDAREDALPGPGVDEKCEPLPIGEMLALGPFDDICAPLTERVRAVLALVQSWEDTAWRKEGREAEWTRHMSREVRDVLNGKWKP